jgi:hypothetical protein
MQKEAKIMLLHTCIKILRSTTSTNYYYSTHNKKMNPHAEENTFTTPLSILQKHHDINQQQHHTVRKCRCGVGK